MTSEKDSAIQYIIKYTGAKQLNKNIIEIFEELKTISISDGFSDNDLNVLGEFLINTKLGAQYRIAIINCLVPQMKFPKNLMKKILLWFFTERGQKNITCGVEKSFFEWLTGLIYYEIADLSVVNLYYCSFVFLLQNTNSLGPICKLLCLISKPEDSKKWIIRQIMQVHLSSGCKSHTSALLSLLKSYRPELIPERIPIVNFTYRSFGNLDEGFRNAHARRVKDLEETAKLEDLKWNSWQMFTDKRQLPRLIPPPENINLENNLVQKNGKLVSVVDVRSMMSLGRNPLKIKYPAQILSLLANQAGFHLLIFGDEIIKGRFSHMVYHTLCKVFLMDLLPYTEKEKLHFLRAIKGLHEYAHESIPVVTNFLFHFLLVWDGESYAEEILGLLEWIEIRSEEDLDKYVFIPLKQVFISTDSRIKCLIIKAMGKLLKNWLVMDKKERRFFRSDSETDLVKSIEAAAGFVGSLLANGLLWNKENNTRNILMTSLDFYEVTQAVEQAGDLPTILMMPSSLVYKCLFSGSSVCIARMCDLLNGLQVYSIERLLSLGVFQDFTVEVEQLRVYMLDYYRCLWSNLEYQPNEESLFHENVFSERLLEFKKAYGNAMNEILHMEYNWAFWSPEETSREEKLIKLANSYPSVLHLKELVEKKLSEN